MPLKVGDVVRLKTGGPEMTVEVVEAKTPEVICTWLAEKTSLHSRFKSLTLRKIDAESVRTKSSSLFDGIDGR
jgi:uncharacterized protein YodC (DUF2158 family)